MTSVCLLFVLISIFTKDNSRDGGLHKDYLYILLQVNDNKNQELSQLFEIRLKQSMVSKTNNGK